MPQAGSRRVYAEPRMEFACRRIRFAALTLVRTLSSNAAAFRRRLCRARMAPAARIRGLVSPLAVACTTPIRLYGMMVTPPRSTRRRAYNARQPRATFHQRLLSMSETAGSTPSNRFGAPVARDSWLKVEHEALR